MDRERNRTLEELKARLKEIREEDAFDAEVAHVRADNALLGYINDTEVNYLYDEIEKWYA